MRGLPVPAAPRPGPQATPYSGEILVALAAPRLRDRAAYLMDAILPGGEAPADGWRARDLPRRTVVLIDGAVRSMRDRRRAR